MSKKGTIGILMIGLLCVMIFGVNPIERAQGYLHHFLEREYDQAAQYHDKQMQQAFPIVVMAQSGLQIWQQFGNPIRLVQIDTKLVQTNTIVSLQMEMDRGWVEFIVSVAESGMVAGFFLNVIPDPERKLPEYIDSERIRDSVLTLGEEPWTFRVGLTLPLDAESFPVLIILQGSGTHDVDGTIGPNKIYRDLAYGLATMGIGVVRMEKRFYGKSQELYETIMPSIEDEYTNDALYTIEWVRSLPGARQIVLGGHSLGGMVAPKIASMSHHVDGIVLLASTTRRLIEVIKDQNQAIFDGLEPLTPELKALKDQVFAFFDRVVSHEASPEEMLDTIPVSYLYELDGYDPLYWLEKTDCPVLVLHAEDDFQVTDKDYLPLKEAFYGRESFSFVSFPGLSHLFMDSKGMRDLESMDSVMELYSIPAHVDEGVIRVLVEWILAL